MRATVVLGRDLEVLPADVAVHVLVLDAHIGKMDVSVEAWQPVVARPVLDLCRGAVGPSVAVALAAVALLQEPLVLSFQLAVQFDAEDAGPSGLEAFCGLQVGTIELRVVGTLPRPVCARVEGLAVVRVSGSVAFEQAAAVLCQRDRAFMFVHGHALDESLVLEVPQLGRLATCISEIAFRDDPKRTDRHQRARFGSVQGVVSIAVAHRFAVVTMRKIDVPDERITWIDCAIMPSSGLAIPLAAGVAAAPTHIVIAVLGESAAATSKREALIVSIANAIIALARIDVPRIEVTGHGPPPASQTSDQSDANDPIIKSRRRSCNSSSWAFGRCGMEAVPVRGHHALHDVAVLGAVNARRFAPPATRPAGIDPACARRSRAFYVMATQHRTWPMDPGRKRGWGILRERRGSLRSS